MRPGETDAGQPGGLPFELIFLAAPVPASISRERDGCLLAVNDAWIEVMGQTREAVIGRTALELGYWSSEAARQAYVSGLATEASHLMQLNGASGAMRVRLFTRRLDVAPEPLLIVSLTDITPEYSAERALRQTHMALQQRLELYGAIETLARVGYWTSAPNQEEVIWSEGLHALAGIPQQPTLSKTTGRGGIHADDRAAWLAAREAMDGRTVEYRWQRPDDGRWLWLRSRMGRTAVAGNPQVEFGVVQDITAEKEAEQALAAQLAFIEHTMERVPGFVFQVRRKGDGTTRFPYFSAGACEMLELDPQDLRRDSRLMLTRLAEGEKQRLVQTLDRSALERSPWREVYRVVLPRKGLRWYSVDAVPQREADGSTLWFGFTSDVTEARMAEQALKRQHRMLQAVQRAQAAFIESDDKRSAFESLHEALLSVTGSEYGFVSEVLYDANDQPYLQTRAISDISWDDTSRRQYAEQSTTGMAFRQLDSLFGHALRSRAPVLTNDPANDPRSGGLPPGHPSLDAFLGVPLLVGDRLVAMVGLANQPGGFSTADIDFLQPLLGAVRQLVMALRGHAERQRSREQFQATSALLAEKTAELQLTLDSIDQGLTLVNGEGRVAFYNRRLLELLELPESLLATHPQASEVIAFQRRRGDFDDLLQQVDPVAQAYLNAEPGSRAPEHYLRPTRDGRFLEIRTRVLPDGGYVRTYTDVTSYLQSQEQVRALATGLERRVAERTAELERSMKDMEAISYSIAHDLRAPLRSVNGFAALVADTDGDRLSPQGRDMFDRILRSSTNMGQMITDMLELLRVVRVEFEPQLVDMDRLSRGVVDALDAGLSAARIELQPVPPARGDATLLRQVLSNLLDNALKYSRHREVPEIQLGYDTALAAYYLRDNGVGFDMARAHKLFGLFQRLHAGSDVPGTGVGLAIVARIIERHGGRIWADSKPGVGTTFWWTLPAA